jgi:hypothetical protein
MRNRDTHFDSLKGLLLDACKNVAFLDFEAEDEDEFRHLVQATMTMENLRTLRVAAGYLRPLDFGRLRLFRLSDLDGTANNDADSEDDDDAEEDDVWANIQFPSWLRILKLFETELTPTLLGMISRSTGVADLVLDGARGLDRLRNFPDLLGKVSSVTTHWMGDEDKIVRLMEQPDFRPTHINVSWIGDDYFVSKPTWSRLIAYAGLETFEITVASADILGNGIPKVSKLFRGRIANFGTLSRVKY